MAAYVIANVVWKDSESLAVYKRLMPSSVKKYGGRFLVRGGTMEILEGKWSPALVVMEFPTIELASITLLSIFLLNRAFFGKVRRRGVGQPTLATQH